MKSKIKLAGLAFVSALFVSTSSYAVTLSNSGATANIGPVTGFYENVPGSGLAISGPAKVLFTYLGSSAGYNNAFLFNAATLFTTYGSSAGATANVTSSGAGFLSFSYLSNLVDPLANGQGSGGPEMIAFQLISPTEANIFFNDNYPDFNFADMTVNVKISPVPLPAALPLLAASLIGAGAISRRRKKNSV